MNLVEVLSSKERVVLLFLEVDGEGPRLGPLLPQETGAVSGQGVIPHRVVVGVIPG